MYEIQLTEQQFNAIAQDNSRSKKMNIKGMLLAIVFASIGLFFYLKHYMTQVTSINYSDLIFFAPFFVFVLLAIVFIISQNKSKKKIDTNDFSCKVYVDTIIEKSMFEVQNKKFIKVAGYNDYIHIDRMSFYEVEVGQQVYIIETDGELKCHSFDYMNRCIERYNN